MNFGKSFTYIFDDPDWLGKLVGPILFSFIPIVGQITLSGYILDTIRNVSQGVQHPLPSFDIGGQMGRGFRWFLVQLVYSIPIFILAAIMLPFIFKMGNDNYNDAVMALPIIVTVILGILSLIYGIFIAFLLPVAQANFANKNSFASGFAFGDMFRRIGNNFSAWITVFLGLLIASFIAPLGSFLVLVGVLITSTYSQLMVSHLQGQAYAVSENKAATLYQN